MTIFILDNDPKLCAQYLDDKSLDKMIKSVAQALCNIHYDLQMVGLEKDNLIPLDVSNDYSKHKPEWVKL